MDATATSARRRSFWMRRLAEVRAEASRSGRDPALEGVRGIAVAMVFFVHAVPVIARVVPQDTHIQFALAAVGASGQAGVRLFFVLSGFLIYGLLMERKPRYGPFLWRRVQRIYPAFLVVTGLCLAAGFAVPSVSKLPSGAAPVADYLFRSLVLLPGLGPEPALLAVAWTLRYEMAFYLLIGMLALIPAFFRVRRVWRMAAALALLPPALWNGHTGPAAAFVFGILALEVYSALRGREPRANWLAWLTALALGPAALVKYAPDLLSDYPELLAVVAGASQRQRILIVDGVLAGFVLLAALGGNPIARFAAWKPVRAFGIVSYSYYLSHGIAIQLVATAVEGLGFEASRSLSLGAWVLLASFALSVSIAFALFLTVEFPYSLRKRLLY